MFYFYILKSVGNKYYIGYTKNILQRLKMHNDNKVISTKNRGTWSIYYKEQFLIEADAICREKQVKRWKSRRAIERLKFIKIEDPRFCSKQNRDQ